MFNAMTVIVNKEKVRILHVDDDPSFLEVTREILETGTNYAVEGVLSVEEALEKIRQHSYAVIISDYKMPIKNGLDLLKELCLIGITTPFILFTVKESGEIEDKVADLGAFRYFCKSGKPEDVFFELSSYIASVVKDNLQNPHSERVTVEFSRFRHVCKYKIDFRCTQIQNYCSSECCPQIQ